VKPVLDISGLSWNFAVFERIYAPSESVLKIGVVAMIFISVISCNSDAASFVPSQLAIYSASVIDRATIFCFLVCQLISNPPMIIITPLWDFADT
jgi:hypothetical protein